VVQPADRTGQPVSGSGWPT